jgi:hypothetical protein
MRLLIVHEQAADMAAKPLSIALAQNRPTEHESRFVQLGDEQWQQAVIGP